MFELEAVIALISKYGLVLLGPIAVVEGPIVTVIASWLASQGVLNLWAVIGVVVLANLIGDLGHYALGRWGLHRLPERWRDRLGLDGPRLQALATHFRTSGARTLLVGKFTQVVIAPILIAAGLARMSIWKFSWVTVVGTVPTSLFFVVLGYTLGSAYQNIDHLIGRVSLIGLGIVILGGVLVFFWRRARA
jgi:membrane protein DedA with SNARE-associated domain